MNERSGHIWRWFGLTAITILVLLGWMQRHRFVAVAAGAFAPAYSAMTLDGREVSLESFRGKVVLLNVWATWCVPCAREMPALERAYRELGAQGLEVVAVSVDAPLGGMDSFGRPAGDIKAFVDYFKLSFTILHDPDRSIEKVFQVVGLPTTFLIDRNGRIADKVVGAAAWDDATHMREIRALLDADR